MAVLPSPRNSDRSLVSTPASCLLPSSLLLERAPHLCLADPLDLSVYANSLYVMHSWFPVVRKDLLPRVPPPPPCSEVFARWMCALSWVVTSASAQVMISASGLRIRPSRVRRGHPAWCLGLHTVASTEIWHFVMLVFSHPFFRHRVENFDCKTLTSTPPLRSVLHSESKEGLCSCTIGCRNEGIMEHTVQLF